MSSESNKRIVKNTALLYSRMFLTMGISLYTSRIVLNTLGIEDFGIYNVVGGVVLMFSFLNTTMSSATQRFLSFELGKNDHKQLRKVFSMSLNIHGIIAVVIFILAETLGLWFLNSQLNIPDARLNAANWVYQFSILSFMLTIMGVPYNAMIIAHERMNVYAYVSIVEVIMKLIVVYSLKWFGFDNLKMYSVLIFCVTAINWTLYRMFCYRNLSETSYSYFWDKSLFETLMSYAGWSLFGNIAGVAMGQGINILLNLFFGPVINAARAIAYQVNSAVNAFVINFQIAMNPQIVKSLAANDMKYMHQLIYQGSKYSFFLLILITLPILLEVDIILNWWLETVPSYTVLFCRLVLINALIDSISGPLMTAAQATGRIKKYQSVVGGLLLLILPISYIFLRLGFAPQVTLYISISISIIALLSRLWILRTLIQISIKRYFKEVIVLSLLVAVSATIIPLVIRIMLEQGTFRFFIVCILSISFTLGSIYLVGLNRQEKLILKLRILEVINKKILMK